MKLLAVAFGFLWGKNTKKMKDIFEIFLDDFFGAKMAVSGTLFN